MDCENLWAFATCYLVTGLVQGVHHAGVAVKLEHLHTLEGHGGYVHVVSELGHGYGGVPQKDVPQRSHHIGLRDSDTSWTQGHMVETKVKSAEEVGKEVCSQILPWGECYSGNWADSWLQRQILMLDSSWPDTCWMADRAASGGRN